MGCWTGNANWCLGVANVSRFYGDVGSCLRMCGGWGNNFFDDFKKCCPNFGNKYPIAVESGYIGMDITVKR